jgi:hypothetical protein
VDVHFRRRLDNGSIAEFVRPDRVTVRLASYDRTGVVPHDLAHLVVEKALRLTTGLWGSLAAGAEFDSAEIVAGRLRHDHRARSTALRKTNDRDLRLAEMLVGAVLNDVEGRGGLDHQIAGAWAIHRPGRAAPPPAIAKTAADELKDWARRWHALRPSDHVTLNWPTAPSRR